MRWNTAHPEGSTEECQECRTWHRNRGGTLQTWSYQSYAIWHQDSLVPSGLGVMPEERRTIVTDPSSNDTIYYFRAVPRAVTFQYPSGMMLDTCAMPPLWDHALPFTRRDQNSSSRATVGPFLSVEYYQGTVTEPQAFPVTGDRKRSVFVDYKHDFLSDCLTESNDVNRYQSLTKTVYHDDAGSYAQTVSSNFDGLGHFRQSETSGSFGGSPTHISFTGFNPASDGTYKYYDGENTSSDTYVQWPENKPWILGTFDAKWDQETVSTTTRQTRSEYCFGRDAAGYPLTGLLTRQRAIGQIAPSPARRATDTLVAFTYDSFGNVSQEAYYGGDPAALGGTGSVPLTGLCTLTLPTATYSMTHTYQHGLRATSKYAGTSLFSLNTTVDQGGHVTQAKDAAEVTTDFDYDSMGRLIREMPQGAGAWTEYAYTPAAGSTGPVVEAIKRPFGVTSGTYGELGHERYTYDGFGRLIRSEKLMPESTDTTQVWSRQDTVYDSMGRRQKVSEAEKVTPTHWTEYTYDLFGRTTRIRPPDYTASNLHETTIAYTGARLVSRTMRVATTQTTETAQITTETYNALGQLTGVAEPGGPTTTYGYDVGGHLASVSMVSGSTTQARGFLYDGRGFLIKEDIPEKTPPTSPSTYYQTECRDTVNHDVCTLFDARGNARRRYDGDERLRFSYDSLERLTSVTSGTSTTPPVLKEFTYATANSGGNKQAGKLITAIAHNRFDGTTDFTVQEGYVYNDLRGRVSQKTVTAGSDAFTQTFTWNDLGQVATLGYPQKTGVGSPRTLTYEYRRGFLTGVPGYASTVVNGGTTTLGISYHANGMYFDVHHDNGVVERQTLAANAMARPDSFATFFATGNWSSGTYAYDGAGNIKAMGSSYFVYDGMSRVTKGAPRGGAWHYQSYAFDAFGNTTSIATTTCGRANAAGTACYSSGSWSTDTRTIGVTTATNRLSTGAVYDAAGNLTSLLRDSVTTSYAWYPTGAMRRMQRAAGHEWDYRYTVDGERVVTRQKRAVGDEITTYTLRGLDGKPLRVYRNANGTWLWERDYVYRGGLLLATVSPGLGVRQAHVDHLGTVRYMTTRSKQMASYHTYFPFGEEAPNPPSSTAGQPLTAQWDSERIKFTGHERDLQGTLNAPADDLDYMHARYYGLMVGRFASTDPGAYDPFVAMSWNRFAYAEGNPVGYVDLSGKNIRMTYRKPSSDFGHIVLQVVDRKTGNILETWSFGPDPRVAEQAAQNIGVAGHQTEDIDAYLREYRVRDKLSVTEFVTDSGTDQAVIAAIKARKAENERYRMLSNSCGNTAMQILESVFPGIDRNHIYPSAVFRDFTDYLEQRAEGVVRIDNRWVILMPGQTYIEAVPQQ